MAYKWPRGFELEYFSPGEFDHPELMDPLFLADLDRLREACGFALTITDDARDQADLDRIYAREIAKGVPYPRDSAHLYLEGGPLVRAVDLKPGTPRAGDGSTLTLEERELELTHQILKFWGTGWEHLGLGIESAHWHIDDTPRLEAKRPAFWVAVSR
jgi:hypothetical protein